MLITANHSPSRHVAHLITIVTITPDLPSFSCCHGNTRSHSRYADVCRFCCVIPYAWYTRIPWSEYFRAHYSIIFPGFLGAKMFMFSDSSRSRYILLLSGILAGTSDKIMLIMYRCKRDAAWPIIRTAAASTIIIPELKADAIGHALISKSGRQLNCWILLVVLLFYLYSINSTRIPDRDLLRIRLLQITSFYFSHSIPLI